MSAEEVRRGREISEVLERTTGAATRAEEICEAMEEAEYIHRAEYRYTENHVYFDVFFDGLFVVGKFGDDFDLDFRGAGAKTRPLLERLRYPHKSTKVMHAEYRQEIEET